MVSSLIFFYLAFNYPDPDFMKRQRLTVLINRAAEKYSVESKILAAMVFQESKGDACAIRYEPAFFSNYVDGKSKTELSGHWPTSISNTTERIARATSWGLLQVMGQVAREEGFEGESLAELCRPAIGIEYGAKHLARHLKTYGGDYTKALKRYNGSSQYPPLIFGHVDSGRYKAVYFD